MLALDEEDPSLWRRCVECLGARRWGRIAFFAFFVLLFDSGSSYSFMSQAFALKYNQEVAELEYSYHISSAGADISTKQMVHGATIEISDRKCMANLIVLPGLGLDVILGMSWMKVWGVVLDVVKRIVTLTDPQDGDVC